MKKKSKVILAFSIFLVLALVGVVFFSGLIKLNKQQVYGSFSDKASCLSYIKDYLCTEGYSCYDCKLVSLTNKYGADCYLGASTVPSASNICSSSSMVTSHSRYSCYSGSVYWFDSTGKNEGVKETCSNGCTDSSLSSAKCNAVATSTSATYPSVTYCAQIYYTNCPNGCNSGGSCFGSSTKCVSGYALSNGVCKQVYSVTACKSMYGLTCPNGCFINANSCADGSSGKIVVDVPVVLVNPPIVVSAPIVVSDNSEASIDVSGGFDCSAVSCPDYCDSSGTSFSSGACQSTLGGCVYNSVSTNSPTCVQSSSSCKVYSLQDGSSCGVNKAWVSSIDAVGCTTFSCANVDSGIVPVKGVPPIFWYILGGFIVLILIVIIIVVSKKKSKR